MKIKYEDWQINNVLDYLMTSARGAGEAVDAQNRMMGKPVIPESYKRNVLFVAHDIISELIKENEMLADKIISLSRLEPVDTTVTMTVTKKRKKQGDLNFNFTKIEPKIGVKNV